jgi:hypothetical protein
LKPLRGFRGAALPGQSLVVYDPDCEMVVDLMPCEDDHAQERTLMEPLIEPAQAGQLWIADRNFSTRGILLELHNRKCSLIVREHGRTPNPRALDALRYQGRIASGSVYEQAVAIEDDDGHLCRLRRVEICLDEPTEGGETVIRVLTNLKTTLAANPDVARRRDPARSRY